MDKSTKPAASIKYWSNRLDMAPGIHCIQFLTNDRFLVTNGTNIYVNGLFSYISVLNNGSMTSQEKGRPFEAAFDYINSLYGRTPICHYISLQFFLGLSPWAARAFMAISSSISVVTDLGLSSGYPRALSHIRLAVIPMERPMPKSTV